MSKKVICTIPARVGSRRLPRKIFLPIKDKPVLQWTIESVAKATKLSEIWVVTPKTKEDNEIIELCKKMYDIHWAQGDETDIISRILGVANHTKADIIVNVDGEQPLMSAWVIDKTVEFIEQGYPFFGQLGIPLGVRCYGFTRDFLKIVYAKKKTMTDNNWWKLFEETAQEELPQMCVDTREDYIKVKELMEKNL